MRDRIYVCHTFYHVYVACLKELNLPFYDPFMIIQKTQGRMAEDDFWIQIER